ncbi:MAG: hypothetical protein AAF587_24095 [Bacteroidota bacterium]
MDFTRIFTDSEGNSHFETIPVHMEAKTDIGFYSTPEEKISRMYFQHALPHHEWPFHSVKDKIQLVFLKGIMEFEVSNGERKQFGPGDVVLLDDHSGQGHKGRTWENTATVLAIHFK